MIDIIKEYNLKITIDNSLKMIHYKLKELYL